MKAVFIDTMGWFSLLNRRDAHHHKASEVMARCRKRKRPLITSDYIVDETATLLKLRGSAKSLESYFEMLEISTALTITFIGPDRFQEAIRYFRKHADHEYSFTDVTSFIVMHELSLRQVLTHDRHFTEAGFEISLP